MIRFGTYTVFEGQELRLVERVDHFRLVFEGPICPSDKFVKYAANVYYLDVPKVEVTNSFFIRTYGTYRGFRFDINQLNDSDKIGIVTDSKEAYDSLHLEFRDRGVYQKDVELKELESLWEEYSQTALNLPMPKELPAKRQLEIPQ